MGLTAKDTEKDIIDVTPVSSTQVVDFKIEDAVIATLEKKYGDIKDASSPAIYKVVMAGLKEYRDIRLKVSNRHKELKKDALEYGRKVDGEKNRLLDLLSPGEDHLKTIRKVEDDKAAAIEKERVNTIRKKIHQLDYKKTGLMNLSAGQLKDLIKEVEETQFDDDEYQEFTAEAKATAYNVVITVKSTLENREKLDKELAEQKVENERLEKIRLEQEAEKKKLAEQQAKIDEENRKIQEEKDKIEAEKKAEQERKAREEFEKKAKEEAERKAKEAVEKAEKKQREISREKIMKPFGLYREGQNREKICHDSDFVFDGDYVEWQDIMRMGDDNFYLWLDNVKAQIDEYRERLIKEQEAQAEKDALAKLKADQEEKARKLALLPDKEKVFAYILALQSVPSPNIKDEKLLRVFTGWSDLFHEICEEFKLEIENL